MHILVVEDEQTMLEDMASYLETEGFQCQLAPDFSTALSRIDLLEYQAVLVDLNLPDGDGLRLVEMIKKQYRKTGIIIISARDSIEDRIKGLELGADDYLVKPFHLSELHARLRSLIRRIRFEGENRLEFGEITVFPEIHQARVNGKPLDLTRKEFDLLVYLVTNKNRVITRESIAEFLWGDYQGTAGSFDFVYTHIKNLRKKIMDLGGEDYIRNIYGVGYKFTKP